MLYFKQYVIKRGKRDKLNYIDWQIYNIYNAIIFAIIKIMGVKNGRKSNRNIVTNVEHGF